MGDCLGDRDPGKIELPELYVRVKHGMYVRAKRADVVAWINERLKHVKEK